MKSADRVLGRRRRLLLALALSALLFALVLVFACRTAVAAVDGAFLQLGSEALAFPGTIRDAAGTIRVNNTDVSYRVQVVPAPLSEVWAHYSRTCGGLSDGSSAWGPLVRTLATRGALAESHAYVACVGVKRDDLPSIAHSAKQLADSWDLSELGALRYVYARSDSVEPERTLLFTSWVDGSFNLHNFVMQGLGDNPGDDLENVPRPRGSRRVLSVERSPHRLAVYQVEGVEPRAQARWYAEQFRSRGWNVLRGRDGRNVEIDGVLLVVAEDGERTATVVVSGTESGETLVTAIEAGAS